MQADSIKIESEDDGFHLIVVTDAAHHDFRIQSCAEALQEQVNLIIGGWLAEGDQALRRALGEKLNKERRHLENVALGLPMDEPYDLDDPKHPDYHSVHADIYDNREKV